MQGGSRHAGRADRATPWPSRPARRRLASSMTNLAPTLGWRAGALGHRRRPVAAVHAREPAHLPGVAARSSGRHLRHDQLDVDGGRRPGAVQLAVPSRRLVRCAIRPSSGSFPDYAPRREMVITTVADRSEVLPVGVDLARLDGPAPPGGTSAGLVEPDGASTTRARASSSTRLLGLARSAAQRFGSRSPANASSRNRLTSIACGTEAGDRIVHDGYRRR